MKFFRKKVAVDDVVWIDIVFGEDLPVQIYAAGRILNTIWDKVKRFAQFHQEMSRRASHFQDFRAVHFREILFVNDAPEQVLFIAAHVIKHLPAEKLFEKGLET